MGTKDGWSASRVIAATGPPRPGPGRWPALAAYALGALGPLLCLVIATLRAIAAPGQGQAAGEWLALALPLGRRLGLYLESIGLALIVSAAAVALGWVAALFLWSGRRPWRSRLVWLALPLVALPPYVHALAWLSLGDLPFRFLLAGRAAVVWVQVAAFAPLALGCAWLGLRGIDPELLEAGRVAQSDLQTLWRIALPLSAPALRAALGIIFLLSLLDYSVPSLFHVPVYAMEVLAEFNAGHSAERAFVLALPLLALAVAVIAAILEPIRTLTVRQLRRGSGSVPGLPASPPHWPRWVAVVLALGGVALALQAAWPLAVLLGAGADVRQLASTLAEAGDEVGYSLWAASLAALFGLPLAAAGAHALGNDRGAGRRVCILVVLLPLAVPASLVGIGLILLQQALFPAGSAGWPASLAAEGAVAWAGVARFAPLAALVLWVQVRRQDPLLLEAARLFQPSWWRRQAQVALPLAAPGLLAGAGLVFALTMGELGATLMVVPPGRATLTLRIYTYLHYGATATVAGLCLILATAVLAAGLLAAASAALWPFLWDRQAVEDRARQRLP